jgi:hypothetical protein
MRRALVLGLLALGACGGGTPTPPPTIADDPGYPAGPYGYVKGEVLPDVVLPGKLIAPGSAAEWTDPQTVSFGSLRDPGTRFLLVETVGVWCPDCSGDQPPMLALERDYAARGVRGVEIIVEGNYDEAPIGDQLDDWSRNNNVTGALLLDDKRAFERAAGLIALPDYFIIDAITMRIAVRSTDTLYGTPLGPALDVLLAKSN